MPEALKPIQALPFKHSGGSTPLFTYPCRLHVCFQYYTFLRLNSRPGVAVITLIRKGPQTSPAFWPRWVSAPPVGGL